MRARVWRWRAQGLSVGLVPTMGALHAGHLSLVAASRARDDRTVVSVFVNPLQFGVGEDLESYPRTPEQDQRALHEQGVHAVFAPTVEEMYPSGATTIVEPAVVATGLEGERRPGHFRGVATVVVKLFNAVPADRAYFGRKDAQQLAVVEALQRDLRIGIEIVGCPIVRAADGLALSSRNAYLSPPERAAAPVLYRALKAARDAYSRGERDPDELRALLRSVLDAESLAVTDYAELVNPGTFRAPGPLAVLAVRIGPARLIDNHLLSEPL